jgi:hypothetical protein
MADPRISLSADEDEPLEAHQVAIRFRPVRPVRGAPFVLLRMPVMMWVNKLFASNSSSASPQRSRENVFVCFLRFPAAICNLPSRFVRQGFPLQVVFARLRSTRPVVGCENFFHPANFISSPDFTASSAPIVERTVSGYIEVETATMRRRKKCSVSFVSPFIACG